jgi:ketosteroid isomerase-like protein
MTNLEIVRAVYAAMAEKDVETVLSFVAPDCVLTQDPALPWGGHHVGHEGLINFALALTGSIDSAVTPEAMYEADERVIQFGRTKGTVVATGAEFDVAEMHAWTVRDGKVVAADFAIDTAAMLEALNR